LTKALRDAPLGATVISEGRLVMATKKTTTSRNVKVKMIQSVDSVPGKDTTVFFTDGTHAVVKSGNKLSDMLTKPENVAPNLIQVTISRGTIVDATPVEV